MKSSILRGGSSHSQLRGIIIFSVSHTKYLAVSPYAKTAKTVPKLPKLIDILQAEGFGIYTSIFAKTDGYIFRKFKYI